MRQLPSAAPHPGEPEMGLPAGVEELLVEVVADGFALYCCGPKAAPNALVAWDRLAGQSLAKTTPGIVRGETVREPEGFPSSFR